MKRVIRKRLWWGAGITSVLILALTVIPGLNYDVSGPWNTSAKQTIPPRSIVCPTGGLGLRSSYRQRFKLP